MCVLLISVASNLLASLTVIVWVPSLFIKVVFLCVFKVGGTWNWVSHVLAVQFVEDRVWRHVCFANISSFQFVGIIDSYSMGSFAFYQSGISVCIQSRWHMELGKSCTCSAICRR